MENKPWYSSITIIAAGFVAFLQGLPTLVAEIDKFVPMDLSVNPVVVKVLTIAAAIVAIYGRFTAKTQIK